MYYFNRMKNNCDNFISLKQLKKVANKYKNDYGTYLKNLSN